MAFYKKPFTKIGIENKFKTLLLKDDPIIFSFFKISLFLIILFACKTSFGQDHDIGTWIVPNANVWINKKWNIFLDPRLYSDKQFNNFYYYEIKGTVGYKVSQHVNFTAGGGKYLTYQHEGNLQLPIQTNETRLFEQLFFIHGLHKLKIEHRFQFEQRFFNSFFRTRYRYRANLTYPINKPQSEKNSFFLVAYDEIFLTDISPRLPGNWMYAGLGFRVNSLFTVQEGYARQYSYTNPKTTYKDFIATSFLFSTPIKK